MLFRALRTAFQSLPSESPPRDSISVEGLRALLNSFGARLDVLETREATRNAEHALMVDQLDRLYKRLSMRLSRGAKVTQEDGESVLSLRQRLGR